MTTKYNYSTPTMIQSCILIWTFCGNRLARMSAYKNKYSADMVAAQLAAVIAAQNMPDEAARAQAHLLLRQGMVSKGRVCCDLFQDFKGYARDAYSGSTEEFDTMLNSAGWNYYTAASAQNWVQLQAMGVSFINFLNVNKEILKTQGFMPADAFIDTVTAAFAEFNADYKAFGQAVQLSREETEARNAALDAIYMDAVSCCLDGQAVFRNEPAIRDEFVFDKVSSLVSPSGPAGLKGYATYTINGEPVVGLTAEIESINKQTTVNSEGFYDFGPLEGGATYTVKYVLGAEVKDTETVNVPVGTTVTRNVEI